LFWIANNHWADFSPFLAPLAWQLAGKALWCQHPETILTSQNLAEIETGKKTTACLFCLLFAA
jgi:hypothetical protein